MTGRKVLPLQTHMFPTGIVVQIRPVSEFTKAHMEMAARKQNPPPPAPMHKVEIGGQMVEEANEADPDYEKALQSYNAEIAMKVMDGTIELSVEVEIDQGELDRVKRGLELMGTPLNEISDKVAYVKHCCMIDVERDVTALFAAIQDITGPKEETVQAATAMFQGDVSGPGHLQLPDPAIGGGVQPVLRDLGSAALAPDGRTDL